MEILSAGVVLERFVVRNVVTNGFDGIIASQTGMVRSANCAAQRIEARRSKAALEPSPRNILCVEQIADVFSRDRNHGGGLQLRIGEHTFIASRTRVADDRTGCGSVGDIASRARRGTIGLGWEECSRG